MHANLSLGLALYAAGRTSEEAIAAMTIADQLGYEYATPQIGDVYLVEKQDDAAIEYLEASVEQQGLTDKFRIRELVTAARDPATGQAYLDRRIPQILASMSEEEAADYRPNQSEWYLLFGFLDRYFELILDLDLTDSTWTNAEIPVYDGIVSRRVGFTAHPKYLEVAELLGIIDVWEQRGPPDFCEKVDSQWVCE